MITTTVYLLKGRIEGCWQPGPLPRFLGFITALFHRQFDMHVVSGSHYELMMLSSGSAKQESVLMCTAKGDELRNVHYGAFPVLEL